MRTLQIIGTFYRNFAFLALLISSIFAITIFKTGTLVLSLLIWAKAGTLLLFYFYISQYKKKELYYYLNLGFSKSKLWTITALLDFALFILLIVIALKTR